MLIVKWLVKSLASMVLMFGVSGYLLYLTSGQTPWGLLGHNTAGSFFQSLLPVVDVNDAKQAVQQKLTSVETAVSQYVPSEAWGVDDASDVRDQQKIYRWVDKDGVTHFSETPPVEGQSEQVGLPPLVNLMPAQVDQQKPIEQDLSLQLLQEKLQQQEAEKRHALDEI